MTFQKIAAALFCSLLLSACDFDVPDLNRPGLADVDDTKLTTLVEESGSELTRAAERQLVGPGHGATEDSAIRFPVLEHDRSRLEEALNQEGLAKLIGVHARVRALVDTGEDFHIKTYPDITIKEPRHVHRNFCAIRPGQLGYPIGRATEPEAETQNERGQTGFCY